MEIEQQDNIEEEEFDDEEELEDENQPIKTKMSKHEEEDLNAFPKEDFGEMALDLEEDI